MIHITAPTEALRHEIYEYLRLLFPTYEYDRTMEATLKDGVLFVTSDGFSTALPLASAENNDVKRAIYDAYVNCGFKSPPWGILRGIRPTKLALQLYTENPDTAYDRFRSLYRVSDAKAQLTFDILKRQLPIIDTYRGTVSLYVHIPFCPSRCTYCSFHTLSLNEAHMDTYVATLIQDMDRVLPTLKNKVGTIYIGGGTPTAIGQDRLEQILMKLDCLAPHEYTVEAGREDTLDDGMFQMLRAHGVNRISINPQSFHEPTLRAINRRGTVADVLACYYSARQYFDCINMDLIVGLEHEDENTVLASLQSAIDLQPENITVHALAQKNGTAYLASHLGEQYSWNFSETINDRLVNAGYEPYYLYRQKRSLGGTENIGYCKKGTICDYNVIMIEEVTDIIGLGMSATSKLYEGERFKQIVNFRNFETYLNRHSETTEKIIQRMRCL
ncbi:coproporphyrinogen dehydrogenase HemZ [Peptoniphilus equinus]|uniref:Coproporphyrinogen dehydrogenase HemZ n=1 Tax=Peptoniphilus equinus TaxID=3016343 RepID=A0ABY7QWK7_9FIRM|nr:coproporphyrinogen dehydrogenase HemZ [Peptoniphilus equinus]WBW50655.1 coproporphyrinogen dehydrogenase HemZ [Peptoniphilus equinus]